jgi:osmoprotectant transport system substrate-binding protein
MHVMRRGALAVAAMALLATAACGSDNSTKTKAGSQGSVTIGSFGFSESVLLADIYAGALRKAGFDVKVKANLGTREIVEPALEKGEIDVVPEYVGNALAILFPDAPKPGDDLGVTTTKLRDLMKAKNLTVLTPSAATDGDAIAVTKPTATKNNLAKISDLAPVAAKLVLGGPPECETRITCKLGLEQIYGLHFKSFKSLDAGGPLTKTALDGGQVDVARLFTADPDIKDKGYVVLDDDRHIQPAGNVVPVARTAKATAALRDALNEVSAKLTTDDLLAMNKRIGGAAKEDPTAVATSWLEGHGFAQD